MKLYNATLFATLMTVTRALHLNRSPWKRLSSPRLRSKRLRGAMRFGLWSSFSVPGAGILMKVDPYTDAGHTLGPSKAGLLVHVGSVDREEVIGVFIVGCVDPQKRPAWNCWSAEMPFKSTALTPLITIDWPQLFAGSVLKLKQGTGPATRPLS